MNPCTRAQSRPTSHSNRDDLPQLAANARPAVDGDPQRAVTMRGSENVRLTARCPRLDGTLVSTR